MSQRSFIGIDPDSQQIICVHMNHDATRIVDKSLPATYIGARNFYNWVKVFDNVIVAFEGSNHHTKLFEKILYDNEFQFYTFKASDVESKRERDLGPAKTNEMDALAAAYLAQDRLQNSTLHKWARYHRADDGLRDISRARLKIVEQKTAEISQLCKFVKSRDSELYLYLMGKHPEYDNSTDIISNKGVLNLLSKYPDLYTWKEITEQELSDAMHTNYTAKQKHIKDLVKISKNSHVGSPGEIVLIRQSAKAILQLLERIKEIDTVEKEIAKDNIDVQVLMDTSFTRMKGIGLATAVSVVSEIIDIRRFTNNNSLAMYSGLGMKVHETGLKKKGAPVHMKKFFNYNRYLKNGLMTMAKNVVLHNPDHRLRGMFKYLTSQGMLPTEAYKRVARALVRQIFKLLWNVKMEDGEKIEKGTGRQNGVINAPIRHTA